MTDHGPDRKANPDESLEARIVSTLDHGCAEMDPPLRRRLDRIRAEALDAAHRAPSEQSWLGSPWTAPAAGLVAASVALALVVVLVDRSPQTEAPPMTADLDVLTDPRFDLVIEDPEFVAWIAEAEPKALSTETSG